MIYQVYENVLSEPSLNYCRTQLNEPRWMYGHTSTIESKIPFWYMELSDNKFFRDFMFGKIQEATNQKFILNRVYANGHTYGQDGDIHKDDLRPTHKTFLFYPLLWSSEYGGKTEFFDDNMNKIDEYTPKENTGIIFPANVFHRGTAPSLPEAKLRITVAFKMEQSP